jgi:hypothetical protein
MNKARNSFAVFNLILYLQRFELRRERADQDFGISTKVIKGLLSMKEMLVGAVGIEPTTFGLKGRCSTTELRP